jgi:hypothetical protein
MTKKHNLLFVCKASSCIVTYLVTQSFDCGFLPLTNALDYYTAERFTSFKKCYKIDLVIAEAKQANPLSLPFFPFCLFLQD